MTSILQRLIDALRDELQQHGEVLGLLDAGSPSLSRQTAARAARAAATFQVHAESLLAIRAQRETFQRQLAWACQRPDAWTPAELLPLVADEVRPLLQALFEENESLRRQLAAQARPDHPWLGNESLLAARLLSPSAWPLPDSIGLCPPPNLIVPGALSA